MAGKKLDQISPSLRWSVFARDGFTCRYCGAQAGDDGVELACDHIVSRAEGGTNAIDNLATSCRVCNIGKSAKSLPAAPASEATAKSVRERGEKLRALADSLREAQQAAKELEQQIVNIKCEAYGLDSVQMEPGEYTSIRRLIVEFGADKVVEWYRAAEAARVPSNRALRYIHGCARTTREEAAR